MSAPPTQMFWDVVSFPFSRGGLGLRSAVLTTNAAFWSSWADSLQMIQSRHPSVAGQILHELSHRNTAGFHVAAAGAAREELMRLGFEAPSWESVTAGRRPAVPDVEDRQIGMPLFGWQQAATDAVHTHVVETTVRPRLNPTEQALLRSQGGPLSGVPFQCFPSQFRILLLRRFWLPLPPSSRSCRCGRPLDVLGHHRAACAEAGVLGRRGHALESAAARICREAGARVGTNIMVRDMDLLPRIVRMGGVLR